MFAIEAYKLTLQQKRFIHQLSKLLDEHGLLEICDDLTVTTSEPFLAVNDAKDNIPRLSRLKHTSFLQTYEIVNYESFVNNLVDASHSFVKPSFYYRFRVSSMPTKLLDNGTIVMNGEQLQVVACGRLVVIDWLKMSSQEIDDYLSCYHPNPSFIDRLLAYISECKTKLDKKQYFY